MKPAVRPVLAITLVATVLVAEASGGDSLATPRNGPRATPRWVERLEASFRRSVESQVMVIAPSPREAAIETVVTRWSPPVLPVRRVLLSPSQFRLPPPLR